MTKEQILEGNKLIAYFLEWKNIGMKDLELWQRFRTDIGVTNDELRFHLEWNWLMPVIEKIYDTGISGGLVAELKGHLWAVNIEQVHKCTVEFIEWYNQNKKSS